MDQTLLQHLLGLVERTGDRIVVVDPRTERPYVIMGLGQYEALVAPPKVAAPVYEPAVQHANADIAAWRSTQVPDVSIAETPPAPVPMSVGMGAVAGFAPEPLQAAMPDDDQFYVEPIE